MFKFVIAFFLMLAMAAPAMAKSRDFYPVSCDDLWAAVKSSLDRPRDYGIVSMSDAKQKASFVVVGALTMYTDKIELTAKDSGCAIKATFLQDGPDDSDWRQFRHRLERSLAKLQAGKTKQTVLPTGQQ